MTKNIAIKKTELDTFIVERIGRKPMVYDSLTELILNEFVDVELHKEITNSNEIELLIEVTVNPPKQA